jgi:hypothetical protein
MRNYRQKYVLVIIALMVIGLISPALLITRVRGSGENWLSGWTYRQKLTIQSATGAGTNYQIPITVLKTGTNSHCRDDFGDLRFTASDGSTLLDYWMQSVSLGSQALFCVNDTDNLSSSNSTIYMYYGNSGATTTSNGKATFQFFDNFSADSSIDWTNTWQSSAQSLYSLSGGNLVCGTTSGGSQLIQTKTSFSGGFCASALVRETDSGGQAYLDMESSSLTYTGKDNEILAYNIPAYLVYLAGTSNSATSPRDTTNFFTMVHKCPSSGNAIGEIWLGSTLKVTYSHAPSYTTAHVGFLDYIAGTELVQWVCVRKYVNPEPYVALAGNEESQPSLTVSVVGSGSVNLNNSGPYNNGDVVQFTAVPADGWSFDHWNGSLTGSTNPAVLVISGSMSVTANFVLTPYTLTVSVVGSGSVNLDNPGPYHLGDTVHLTAVPADGWSFDHWSGNLTGSTNPAALLITGNMAVTANFLLPHMYVDPSSISKGPGDVFTTFQTSVMIERIHDLWGFDVELTWNQSLIALADVDFNTTLDSIWGPGNWFLAYDVTGAGYYELAAVSTSTGLSSTGPVPLVNLNFLVKAAVGQTPIHFAFVELSDSQSQSIQSDTTDGTYTITGPMYKPVLQMTPDTVACRKYGEYFTVQVNVTNAITLDDFNFTMYYDGASIKYVSVTWGELGSGNITKVDPVNGVLEANVVGVAISGNRWLLNITFQDNATMIWKDGQLNKLEGQIWFHYAKLSFSGVQDLIYEEGGLSQISVNDVGFTFMPIQGDINNDGTVGVFDLRTVAAYYDRQNSTYNLTNGDIIDIYDLVVIAANFGYTYNP